ncbi:ANTAR domain-containing protein [Streptomyces chartreusis]
MTGQSRGDDHSTDPLIELEREIQQLKDDGAAHATMNQALGIMVALGHVSPNKGQRVLREVAQQARLPLAYVAELVLHWARAGEIPAEIRPHFEEALGRHGPPQTPGSSIPPGSG